MTVAECRQFIDDWMQDNDPRHEVRTRMAQFMQTMDWYLEKLQERVELEREE